MNNWNFTGNLGKAAETRHTSSGDAVVQFSVAVKSGYGKNEKTTWANCSMWGKRGEAVAPYLTKRSRNQEGHAQSPATYDGFVEDLPF